MKMIDEIFGEVNFDVMWETMKEVKLFDKEYKVLFLLQDYDETGINDFQRESYKKYKLLESKISNNLYNVISSYINKNLDLFSEINGDVKLINNSRELQNVIKPVSYSFLENGNIVIEFDFKYDEENGLGAKIKTNDISNIEIGFLSDFI